MKERERINFSRADSALQGQLENSGRSLQDILETVISEHPEVITVLIDYHKISPRHGGSCLYSQHSRGRGKKISSLRPV